MLGRAQSTDHHHSRLERSEQPALLASRNSSSSSSYPTVGSMYWTSRLHTARSCVCSRRIPLSFISSLILSVHRSFGPPLFLVPCTSKTIFSPTSLLVTRSNHLDLFSGTFLDIYPTCIPPILSFLILSSFINPRVHLNILFLSHGAQLYYKMYNRVHVQVT